MGKVMAVYAIGDLQGCYQAFRRLLAQLKFDPAIDRLWLVGDLVNRGPDSLSCLRFVRGLGNAAITVLGNHDLHLLALAQHPNAAEHANPTLKSILDADDRDELLDWLRCQPLFHRDTDLGWSMVHAGLAPDWTPATATDYAREVQAVLSGPDYRQFLEQLYGDQPDCWHTGLAGWDRLRMIVNCTTRMRLCHPDGRLNFSYKGALEGAPVGLVPWFELPGRQSKTERLVFGHWSALSPISWPQHNVWCIDTGCVWGNALSALRLDTNAPKLTQTTAA